MGLVTTLCNMQPENLRHYLMHHDSGSFTIRELEEAVEYLGKDPYDDFRHDEESMYMYIKERCGCYTEEGNRWR